jgi:hypothetical protein
LIRIGCPNAVRIISLEHPAQQR